MPVTVVIDTNFLVIPAQFSVDIFAETERVIERGVEFVVLSSVLREIEMMAHDSESVAEQRTFRLALELTKRCKVVEYDPEEDLSVDEQILVYAQSVGGVLATNDRKLRDRAREKGVPVLRLRGKKTLSLEGVTF